MVKLTVHNVSQAIAYTVKFIFKVENLTASLYI